MSPRNEVQKVKMTRQERRIARRVDTRGDEGLVEELVNLRGTIAQGRYQIGELYAVGGEGAVFDCSDVRAPGGPPLVGKVVLAPVHRPIELDSDDLRRRRRDLVVESAYMTGNSSPFMPAGVGCFEFDNPLLDKARGEAFAEPEVLMIMEKLPGRDLDRWLARTHRSGVPQAIMRRTLDRAAVVLVQALTDMRRRGLIYADLRPGNMRMLGRPQRRVRMLDAGSIVKVTDKSGHFPHVPSYLPPQVFHALQAGKRVAPSDAIQAVMAGRTLFETATGRVPHPGEQVDLDMLPTSNVSEPVAEVVAGLCNGKFNDVRTALRFLVANASRKVDGGNRPVAGAKTSGSASTPKRAALPPKRSASNPAKPAAPKAAAATSKVKPATSPAPVAPAAAAPKAPARSDPRSARSAANADVLPEAQPKPSFFKRLLSKLFGG